MDGTVISEIELLSSNQFVFGEMLVVQCCNSDRYHLEKAVFLLIHLFSSTLNPLKKLSSLQNCHSQIKQ